MSNSQTDIKSFGELIEEAEELAHFGGWEVDLLTGKVHWSLKMYKILGLDPATTESTFGNFIRIVHRNDVLYIKRNLERLLVYPSDEVYDFRIINQKDKTIKYLRTGIVAKRDENGTAISLTGFSHDITNQKLAEQKLERINKDLNTFFNVIDDVFFSIDYTTKKVIQISPGCKSTFGFTAAELEADYTIWNKLNYFEDHHVISEARLILEKGETAIFQHRIISRDSEIKWLETKVKPSMNIQGSIIRLDGISRDITDRKKAEIEYLNTQNRFKQLVESAQEGIWTIDENNRTNFVNKKMCDILGYSPDEMMGRELFYFMEDEDRADAIACIERRKNGAKESLQIRYKTKNNDHVWTSINTNPIFDENKNYKGALAMVTDITENLMAERALKESEANLRTIFENTAIGFVLYNSDFTIKSFNNQANDYCKLHFKKYLQIGLNGMNYAPDNKKELTKSVLEKVKTGEIVNYEVFYELYDKQEKWYNIKWIAVLNEQQDRIGVLLTIKDITDRKQMELEREKITNDLIARNKEQEQFNYMLSHNLRAPVANINGLMELINETDIKEEDSKFILEGISQSVRKLDSVIIDMNRVIQHQKLLKDKYEINDLDELVYDIKLSIANIIKKDNVEIICNFDVKNLITIKSYLYSIIYNLIINSIKYKKESLSPKITIKSRTVNQKVELSVTDNGKGIDLESYGKELFNLYTRFDTSVEGKGMGLYMVKTQVESIGGTIEVESELGAGTTFIILLPQE